MLLVKSLFRFFIVIFLLGQLLSLNAQYPEQIRFMTYNINAVGHGSGPYDDIAAVITELNPAIVGLQKIDSCNSRNPAFVAQLLGEQTVRSYTFAPAIENYRNSTGSYGVAFLSQEEPLSVRKLHIEPTAKEEGRGVLEIVITMAGEPVRVLVTHLAHEGASYRKTQVGKILTWLSDSGSPEIPTIIMADFNAKPTEASLKLFTDAGFNFVKGLDGTILDTTNGGINHIIYRPADRWNVVDAGNPEYGASNRNPLWTDMKLLNPIANQNDLKIRNGKYVVVPSSAANLISYTLPEAARVSFHLYATNGALVATPLCTVRQRPGMHTIHLTRKSVATGLYIGNLSVDGVPHMLPVHVF